MTHLHHGLTRYDRLVKECLDRRALNDRPLPNTFGRLLPENPVTGSLGDATLIKAYDTLVDDMRTKKTGDGPADAGMTFFGQFVDHDITLDATSAIGTKIDPRTIRNIRTPNLDLDCVYGNGPDASPHLYSEKHEGFLLFGTKSNPRDLARNDRGTALIGDPRNDENIIVSQIQGAFITLHNILMSHVQEGGDTAKDVRDCAGMGVRQAVWEQMVTPKLRNFEEVRRFVRLHYQWLVLNQLLPAFVDAAWLKKALPGHLFGPDAPIMPVEFSGAAYRFGHATVVSDYVLKAGAEPVDLFKIQGFGHRPADADLEMGQFFSTPGSTAQKAQPVNPNMAATLFKLPFVTSGIKLGETDVTPDQAAKLGLRNILRDRYALHLPSGQQVARHLGIDEIPAPEALRSHGITKTPLWFYCLHEAGANGKNRLTGVGAAIVGTVFARLLSFDDESVIHLHDFTPWAGFGGADCTMGGVMAFVEKHRGDVAHADDLKSG